METQDIPQIILTFERELKLPQYFFLKLVDEDDWTFVIKLSSLFEAACTQLLVTKLKASVLTNAIAHLELGNKKYGKLEMLDKLGAIDAESRHFIISLAELRNVFVHDVSKTSTSILQHVESMKESSNIIRHMVFYLLTKDNLGGKEISNISFFKLTPKKAIWIGAAVCLSKMLLKKEELHDKNAIDTMMLYGSL
jgi:hypothetical protein